MSYVPQGADITATLDKLAPTVLAVSKVVEDPALPEIVCEVLRLNKVTAGLDPGPSCPRRVLTEADKRKGLGLYVARAPLRGYVWARQHPGLAWGAAIAAVGIIGLIGYSLGRSSR